MTLRLTSVDQLPAAHRDHARAQLQGAPAKPMTPPAVVPAQKPRKYRNQVAFADGIRFDSRLEARCYEWLKARQQSGQIAWFIRQVPFGLEGGVIYRADFLAVGSAIEVIDAKGRDTQASINKRKQVKARYGVEVQLWTGR